LNFQHVTQNQLVGGGELRYGKVCTALGKQIDLVVTAGPGYSTTRPDKNGVSGSFGEVNLKSGTSTDFTFSFYESGTKVPVTVESLYFSMLDVDGNTDQMESVTFSGFESFSLGANSELKRVITPRDATFMATTIGTAKDNPTNPMKLSALQISRSVTFLYTSVSSFTANFAILGTNTVADRNFIFAGRSSLSNQCDVPVCVSSINMCTLNLTDVVHSNLGGVGPDTGAENIRYGKVCDHGGHSLDLLVESLPSHVFGNNLPVQPLAPYEAYHSSKNGVHGAFGNINLKGGSTVILKFEFVKGGTNLPVKVRSTSLTIFDLDKVGESHVEDIIADGYSSYTEGKGSTLSRTGGRTGDGYVEFTATENGNESDNPSDPLALDDLQLRRSVMFEYTDVSSFTMAFHNKGTHRFGRNYLFAGASSILEACRSSVGTSLLAEEQAMNSPHTSITLQLFLLAITSIMTCSLAGLAVHRFRAGSQVSPTHLGDGIPYIMYASSDEHDSHQ